MQKHGWGLVFWLTGILVLGYLFLEKNTLSSLLFWQVVALDDIPYNWEAEREAYRYTASNIFNRGFFREEGVPLQNRVVATDQVEGAVTKITLPAGFQDGNLWIKVKSSADYQIGYSFEAKTWNLQKFPGAEKREFYCPIFIKAESQAPPFLYIKFLPVENQEVTANFFRFEYNSSVLFDNREYHNYFFVPETDIDFDGKEIFRQGIIYER